MEVRFKEKRFNLKEASNLLWVLKKLRKKLLRNQKRVNLREMIQLTNLEMQKH